MCRILGSASVELLSAVAGGAGGGLKANLSPQTLSSLEKGISKAESVTGIRLKSSTRQNGTLCLSECDLPPSSVLAGADEIAAAGYEKLFSKTFFKLKVGGKERHITFSLRTGTDSWKPAFGFTFDVADTEEVRNFYRELIAEVKRQDPDLRQRNELQADPKAWTENGRIELIYVDKEPQACKFPDLARFNNSGISPQRLLTVFFHGGRSEEYYSNLVLKALMSRFGLEV